jgi:hypothetical protein
MRPLFLTFLLACMDPGIAGAQPFTSSRLQPLLQRFVDHGYGKSFFELGEERDFDHGHVLVDARSREPLAILYHTRELTDGARERNWLQWLDGRIENAESYVRSEYPRTAGWDWFVQRELPKLRERHTITDKMLDPARLGAPLAEGSVQWVFTRRACGAPRAASEDVIQVVLPDRTPVCLTLSAS